MGGRGSERKNNTRYKICEKCPFSKMVILKKEFQMHLFGGISGSHTFQTRTRLYYGQDRRI